MIEVSVATRMSDTQVYNCDYADGAPFLVSEWQGCEQSANEMNVPHRHNGYSIGILIKGKMRQTLDFKQYEVKAPALILMEPNQVHQHTMEPGVELIDIYFEEEFMVPEMAGVISCWRCVFASGIIPLTGEQLEEILSYTHLMMRESDNNNIKRDTVIRSLLSAFVVVVARIGEPSGEWMAGESSRHNMVRQFKMLVDRHFHEKTQVSDYAELLFVSPGHLNDTVKELMGRNAKFLIDEKRIMEAKRLLYWGEQSVKQIAARLNFEDDAYFNRFFKKHSGYTPVSFQKSIREKYN